MVCPGSIEACEGLPDETSEAAAEGTCGHHISDTCLQTGKDASDFVGETFTFDGFTFTWTDDDAANLQPGLDWCRELIAEGAQFFGEHRVDLSHWLGDNQFGTMDRGFLLTDRAYCVDLKWGRGVPVSPVDNKQCRLYALGFMRKHAPHVTDPAFPIHIVIDQPRHPAGGGEWIITLGELLEFGEEARAAAVAALTPGAPRVASQEGCLWCPARLAGCDTYDAFNLEMLDMQFEDLDDGEITLPRAMTPERRAVVLRHRPMIEKWLEALHQSCLNDGIVGNPTGSMKAVDGPRGRSKFTDKDVAHMLLKPLIGEARFENRLISPSALKRFKLSPEDTAVLELLIEPGVSTPILVPEEDARPAIAPIEDKFDEED